MRSEPCWTSYPFQTALSWIAAFVIAAFVVFAAECSSTPAHAGVYVSASGGVTQFVPTVGDGTWYQQAFPHRFLTQSLVYKVGAGYQFSDRWGMEASWVDMGTAAIKAQVVGDDAKYDPVHHVCRQPCPPLGYIKVLDRMRGPELALTLAFPQDGWTPYLKLGAAAMLHRVQMNSPTDAQLLAMQGVIPMLAIGGGIKRDIFYAESTWYQGLGGPNCLTPCGFPVATQALVIMLGVKIPLGS